MIVLWLIVACIVVLCCGIALGYWFGYEDGRQARGREEWHDRYR